MNVLLIFFAFPVATIILAIVLQKLIHSPLLVGATFFAIFLVVTFAAFDESFLVYAILYAILAFITALITRFICCIIKNSSNPCINGNNDESNDNSDNNCNMDDLDSCGCGCNRSVNNQYFMRRNMMRR